MPTNDKARVFELTVNIEEFPDYVTNCPCIFTREYMMKKIRRERYPLIKKIMDHIETSSRTNGYPIECVDTDEPVVTISHANVIIRSEKVKIKKIMDGAKKWKKEYTK